ncbi:DNA ligase [Rhodanobacter sp. Root627]|uniref:RNA ligase family protein n=1 Tax=Rhodanobacter sp. Root627 TaxID=1736572 RepID=UPI0006F9AD50|nr:RNA ligase family protein [Rhodanobacter sp. Root627]KRA33537.1 DNA ligase [Rhodanobacter sp. Root627]
MSAFFRFPHTPHLAWLGVGQPRDDKVLSTEEATILLSGSVVVEEKLDGANLGISLAPDGQLRAQNRGQYQTEPLSGQFSRLASWLTKHRFALTDHLDQRLILFGEWCAAKHSLDYESLPDWFLLFDVYDRVEQRFWSSTRRNAMATSLGLSVVPRLFHGRATLSDLKALLQSTPSLYRNGPPEGLVIRAESEQWCEARAKLVQPEFTQAIGEHWRNRSIEWNHLQRPTGTDA